jgi:hypothetical protein
MSYYISPHFKFQSRNVSRRLILLCIQLGTLITSPRKG